MARLVLSLSAASTVKGYENFSPCHKDVDPVTTTAVATYATDKAAFEAALAVCVADAASPTQAHVTAADAAYTTFKAELGGTPVKIDLVVSIDTARITSITSLRAALNRVLLAAASAGMAE